VESLRLFKKKIVNPILTEFEAQLKKRGFLLVKAFYAQRDIYIYSRSEFINHAKRSGVQTIFVDESPGYNINDYFYLTIGGCIVNISIRRRVKE